MTSIKDEPQEQQFALQSPSHANSPKHGPMTDYEYQLIQQCTQALNYLMSFEITGPFIMPAPRNYPYYNSINQAMDLTTLEHHLYSRYYTSYQAFETHLSLIWRNAMKFHQQHSLIYKKAAMLEQLYNVFKQDLDQSLRSVTSDPVEVSPPPPPPKTPQPPSRSEQMDSDLYMVLAVSPLESPLMVQHYENFAYARPVYDELHGPLFKRLLKQQEQQQHQQQQENQQPQRTRELEPYPRLYISRNRHYLFNALETKRQSIPSTMTILWNTYFEAPPPPSHPFQQQYIDQLVIMTTHVTHGTPYAASHNAFRSASSYLPASYNPATATPTAAAAAVANAGATFIGTTTTSDFDYSPQAWLKFQPTRTFYNIQMVISKRMVDAYFSRAFAIQPVSAEIQKPIDYPQMQPWINNAFDILLVNRMKQCLISGKNDLTVLDQLPVPVPMRPMPQRQKNGDGDHPIVISDDEAGGDDNTTTTTTAVIIENSTRDMTLTTTGNKINSHEPSTGNRHHSSVPILSLFGVTEPSATMIEATSPATPVIDDANHDTIPAMNQHISRNTAPATTGTIVDSRHDTAPTIVPMTEDSKQNTTPTSTSMIIDSGHNTSTTTTMNEDNNGEDISPSTAMIKHTTQDAAPIEVSSHHIAAGTVTIATSKDKQDTTTPTETTTKEPNPILAKNTSNDDDVMLEQLDSTNNDALEQTDNSSVSSTLLDVMDKLRDFASRKGVKMVNVNDYMENSVSSELGVDGHFKRVRYVTDNNALVVLLFRRMTTSQRVHEIVSLLKLKGQPRIGNIVDILYVDGDENNLAGFTMDRYGYTLKQYTQEQSPTHQHLTPCQKLDLIRQMLQCLQCIHDQGIAHRDLSEGNFMVDHADDKAPLLADDSKGVRVRLIDFGRAMFTTTTDVRQWWVGPDDGDSEKHIPTIDIERSDDQLIPMTEDELHEWCTNLPMISTYPDHNHRLYRSIQTLPRTQKDFGKLPWLIDPRAEDVYSVGVLMWRVFTDKEPWNGVMERDIVDLHVMMKDDAAIKLQVSRGISGDHSQRFLLKCLRAEHEDRLSAKKLLTRLNTPPIAQGMLNEWATYYSSTSSRSRRSAAAARSHQGQPPHSIITKAIPKKKKKGPSDSITMERRESNSSTTSSTRSQKQNTSARTSAEPVSLQSTGTKGASTLAAKSTIMEPLAVDRANFPTPFENLPPFTPEITKGRTQPRKIVPARSTSPYATLKSPSSSSTTTTTTIKQQPSSLPSTPQPTVHIPSAPSYLASTPPTSPGKQQPSGNSAFFTTNVANNPHFFLISYPPSHIRAQKRPDLSQPPPPPPPNFTQQHLDWMYDANLNLKLPSRGLVMDNGPSSTIFDETDSQLTPAQITTTTTLSSSARSPTSYSVPPSDVKHQQTYGDAGGIEPTTTTTRGMKRKNSSPTIANEDDDDSDKATKKQHFDDNHSHPSTPNHDQDIDMDGLGSDDDFDDEDDDSNDEDFYVTDPNRKRGRPPGTKSRRGDKPLGRPRSEKSAKVVNPVLPI